MTVDRQSYVLLILIHQFVNFIHASKKYNQKKKQLSFIICMNRDAMVNYRIFRENIFFFFLVSFEMWRALREIIYTNTWNGISEIVWALSVEKKKTFKNVEIQNAIQTINFSTGIIHRSVPFIQHSSSTISLNVFPFAYFKCMWKAMNDSRKKKKRRSNWCLLLMIRPIHINWKWPYVLVVPL